MCGEPTGKTAPPWFSPLVFMPSYHLLLPYGLDWRSEHGEGHFSNKAAQHCDLHLASTHSVLCSRTADFNKARCHVGEAYTARNRGSIQPSPSEELKLTAQQLIRSWSLPTITCAWNQLLALKPWDYSPHRHLDGSLWETAKSRTR